MKKTSWKPAKEKKARELCDQAFAELGEGNQEGFLSCIENAINADERFAYPWNLKGVMYADNLDKFEEALECYKKALLLDPNYVDAWNNKGFALQSLGRVEDAQLCYKSAEDAKKKVEALKGLKRAQLRLGNDLEDKVAKIIETSESSDMTLDSPKSPVGSSKNSLEEIPRLDCSLPKTISFSSHNVTTSFVTSSILENNSPSKLIKASENNMPSKPQKISSEPPSSEVIISDFSLKRVITLSPFTESISEEEETKIDFPNFEDITNHRNKVAIQSQQTIIT